MTSHPETWWLKIATLGFFLNCYTFCLCIQGVNEAFSMWKQPSCRLLCVNLLCKNKIFFSLQLGQLASFTSFIKHTHNWWYFFPLWTKQNYRFHPNHVGILLGENYTSVRATWNLVSRWNSLLANFGNILQSFPLETIYMKLKIYSRKMIGGNACEMWRHDFHMDSIHIHRYFTRAVEIASNNVCSHCVCSCL